MGFFNVNIFTQKREVVIQMLRDEVWVCEWYDSSVQSSIDKECVDSCPTQAEGDSHVFIYVQYCIIYKSSQKPWRRI